jgi:hypothetical protein
MTYATGLPILLVLGPYARGRRATVLSLHLWATLTRPSRPPPCEQSEAPGVPPQGI